MSTIVKLVTLALTFYMRQKNTTSGQLRILQPIGQSFLEKKKTLSMNTLRMDIEQLIKDCEKVKY
jgi:hypothetical protein